MSKCRDGEATTYQMVDHLRYGALMVARLALLLCALLCDNIMNHRLHYLACRLPYPVEKPWAV